MKAMILKKIASLAVAAEPLEAADLPVPVPEAGEILLKVRACGVCHTELDEIEGRTPPPHFPVVPGHQVVGVVTAAGPAADRFPIGARVGVAWIYSACGRCELCRLGNENLCSDFKATGRDADGGYAEYMKVPERFAYPLPDNLADAEVAPLLCAGAIGFRSLRLSGLRDGQRLGLTGFGASAHLVLKLVQRSHPRSPVCVFARQPEEQAFARELGAVWAGATGDRPPERLHAIIDTTPAWEPVVTALKNLVPGGRLVINAIRKETADQHRLLDLDYAEQLWMEKEIKSVANVTRGDVVEFLELAGRIPIRPEYRTYPLEKANQALLELKQRNIRGAKVLVLDS